jgi:hypothetical protein
MFLKPLYSNDLQAKQGPFALRPRMPGGKSKRCPAPPGAAK